MPFPPYKGMGLQDGETLRRPGNSPVEYEIRGDELTDGAY
jgi:hypothetical protein